MLKIIKFKQQEIYMKLAEELSEEERQEFLDYFYLLADEIGLDDTDSPCPWGCPWYFRGDVELTGETIKEMSKNYYTLLKDEIIKVLEIQKKLSEEE